VKFDTFDAVHKSDAATAFAEAAQRLPKEPMLGAYVVIAVTMPTPESDDPGQAHAAAEIRFDIAEGMDHALALTLFEKTLAVALEDCRAQMAKPGDN